jgi:hypothetical protein
VVVYWNIQMAMKAKTTVNAVVKEMRSFQRIPSRKPRRCVTGGTMSGASVAGVASVVVIM